MNKYNWKRTDYPSRQDDWKSSTKIIQQLLSMCYILKVNI